MFTIFWESLIQTTPHFAFLGPKQYICQVASSSYARSLYFGARAHTTSTESKLYQAFSSNDLTMDCDVYDDAADYW